ncbi:MAG: hypothetical protein VKP62_09500 [Candidatus Sericytochromatia bacterium]|nr:hypothetical protein [Candidatus Sericytochromatia bacterium]
MVRALDAGAVRAEGGGRGPEGPSRPAAPEAPAQALLPGDVRVRTREERDAQPTYRPPSLREQIAIAERLMGKPARFKTEEARQAYLASLENGLPQEAFDPQGFLAQLGLVGVRSGGRTDRGFLQTLQAMPEYRPTTTYQGEEIWAQQRAFDLARAQPDLFLGLTSLTNAIVEAPAALREAWRQPLPVRQTPRPTGESPQQRYRDALKRVGDLKWRFGPDFHYGLPTLPGAEHPRYGTLTIARSLGFSEDTARRLASHSQGIDDNTTPYSKTGPSPFQGMPRHFNLDRDAQDSRLVYASQHLARAIEMARLGAFEEAEIELGCGLHSLQDVFAHGQISPSVHGVIGEFPDEVDLHPVALYEATLGTAAYLAAYLEGITRPAPETPR